MDDLWADRCVVGEADGKGKYERRPDVAEAHWQEKQRHEWLEDRGFEVARWGTREAGGSGVPMVRRIERAFTRRDRVGRGWPDGVEAEIRALPGVAVPTRVAAEVARLQGLGVPICFAPPDLWRPPEPLGSIWTSASSRADARTNAP